MITIPIDLIPFIIIVVAVAFFAAFIGAREGNRTDRKKMKIRERAAKKVEEEAEKAKEEAHQLQEANIAHSFVLDEREATVEEKELQLREAASSMRAQMKLALNQSLDDTVIMELPNWEEVPNGSS